MKRLVVPVGLLLAAAVAVPMIYESDPEAFLRLFSGDRKAPLMASAVSDDGKPADNLQGRRVRTLLDAPLQAGESRTLDVNAAELANGLYMVRLQNAAHVQTLRVSVVR